MDIKLLPCPFCGGEARLQRRNKKHGYYVVCKACGCRTPYYQYQFLSREELRNTAIATWNTRIPIDRIIEQLERLCEYNSEQTFTYHDVENPDRYTREMKDLYMERVNCYGLAIRTVRNGGKE